MTQRYLIKVCRKIPNWRFDIPIWDNIPNIPNIPNYLDLLCSVYVVTSTTGLSYSIRSHLKKWLFLDLREALKKKTIESLTAVKPPST